MATKTENLKAEIVIVGGGGAGMAAALAAAEKGCKTLNSGRIAEENVVEYVSGK